MKVYSSASVFIHAPREAVFQHTNDPEWFPGTFTGYGPIPGMVKVENTNGEETREGTIRLIHNKDGSVLEEHMIVHRAPEEMAYEIRDGLKPPFSFLVKKGGGHWTFTEKDGGTFVEWKFYFELTSPLVWPVGYLVGSVFFPRAQQVCLNNTKTRIEAESSGAAEPATA